MLNKFYSVEFSLCYSTLIFENVFQDVENLLQILTFFEEIYVSLNSDLNGINFFKRINFISERFSNSSIKVNKSSAS